MQAAEQTRKMWFHWQNLNDRKDGSQGAPIHGRCWWHFASSVVCFSWNLWTHFCHIEFDVDDEDATFGIAFPPIAFWFSVSSNWWLIKKYWPHRVLSANYPDTIVIDEREIYVGIHGVTLWIKPWAKKFETSRADPWWVRGINFSINPFEWKFQKHEVRRADGSWELVPRWQIGVPEPQTTPEVFQFPYRYVLKNGTIQYRTATVKAERRSWRPRCLQWTRIFEKVSTVIDVQFSDEVGERSGSWKGGCIGCSWELQPGESPEQALKRMESSREF